MFFMKKIIGVPTSQGTLGKYSDVENGVRAILNDFIDYEEIVIENTNQEELLKKIEKKANKDFIAVGGDHSISYSLFKAFKKLHPKEPILIVFDAHPDCEVHTDIPSHEDWVRMLVEEEEVKPENVYLVGITKITKREREFIKKSGINVNKEPPIEGNIYLSIDLDVLDLNCFYYPEGKMLEEELFNYLNRIKPKCLDIVELCPNLGNKEDVNKVISIARRIIKSIIQN